MAVVLINSFKRFVGLSWLIGPILDKELRVSSRRARNYILRFAYLVFLTTFLVLTWLEAVDYGESGLYMISRMARAGKTIVSGTVWFQFCVTQIVVVIMLSSSISEEIYTRTLGLLMTTPISSFQIVMGKLFSKLLQLILLLAISMPVLAIVRVFGGVPWDYIVSSLCIILTSTFFVGSLSLFFSIFSRKTYVSIILTSLALGALFLGIPYLVAMIHHAITGDWPGDVLTRVLFYDNPVMVLVFNTQRMMSPGFGGGFPAFYWPLHCGIMLGGSALILFASVMMVRKVALSQAIGERHLFFRPHRTTESVERTQSDVMREPSKIIRVEGPPVLWKEMRFPLLGRRKALTLTAVLVGLIGLLISYLALAANNDLDDQEVHIVYAIIFLGFGMLFSIVIPATTVTSEKDSRCWPLLLATTLDDNEILLGKFVGSFRRCLPGWSLLLGHVFVFSLMGLVHPIAICQTVILVIWIVTFLCGTGLYFSVRCKHATMAVLLNFALAAVIWAILPLFGFIALDAMNASDDLAEAYMDTHPFFQAVVIMDATVGEESMPDYDWSGIGDAGSVESTIWMLICMGVYALLGSLFAWRAKRRLRRNIF
ncbi:MAG: ABC transporter permease subunit [Phycisphaerales bacterium]|nr:MAG: ABC transporter permease subunit [Phycisphaerales bacterium]